MANFIPCGDPGLFDEFVQDLDVAAFETPLMRVGGIVQWEMFEPAVKAAVTTEPKGPGGRRRFHPLLMFKVLVLQRLHGLAGDATGFQITDRKSFRAFLGLTPGDAVPDGQTIGDFRQALIDAGSIERLFDTFLVHLQREHGPALATQGVMVDASFARKCPGSAATAKTMRGSKRAKCPGISGQPEGAGAQRPRCALDEEEPRDPLRLQRPCESRREGPAHPQSRGDRRPRA